MDPSHNEPTTTTRSEQAPARRAGLARLIRIALWAVLVIGVGWASRELTLLAYVPHGVRVFYRLDQALEAHAAAVRGGAIVPEPDPNQLVRYPVSDELKRGGVVTCLERDGVLWYVLPSHPLDGGAPYLVTPRNPSDIVTQLPGRLGHGCYQFQTLRGNWAYWFRL